MSISATPEITAQLVEEHGLSSAEYDKLKRLLNNRQPTLTELGIFSVMWSEHCSYKSSRVHLKRLPTHSRRVLQGPGENAGIIAIGDGWGCAFKIESHNHPSFIEAFQGAATGVGGILRDIFTMGARPVALLDSLRFGPLESAANKPGPLGSPLMEPPTDEEIERNHSLLEGVVRGIASYGNCFGVPNLGGETKFEPSYSHNPLVNVFALGLVRQDKVFYAKATGEGNPVIYVGAKTGRDGIHGATMASEEFSQASEAKRPNVQVGDPFLEKLLLEACLEAMQTGAVIGIQDMGAAGLTCSTAEMGARGRVGIEIELDRVPQRETGMTAYEIMLSESQERMLLVAEKGRQEEVFQVFQKWGLDAVEIGQVTLDGQLRVLEHGQVVAEIATQALTEDAPVYQRPLERWEPPVEREIPARILLSRESELGRDLKRLLSSGNICAKRWIWQQYDSMVQTNTVQGPGASDAGVIRIKGSKRGLAMALEANGRWCYLDPRLGAMHAVAQSARKVACVGATPVGATNCLNFGNPEKPPIMWQFSQVIDGLSKACEELEIPITGGNVSFYNETLGEAIYPTPVVGVVGILEDIHQAVSMEFRQAGHRIVVLRATQPGDRTDAESEFGSSEYAKEVLGALWGYPPQLELEREAALQKALLEMIAAGLIDSAHDCAEGGVALSLAECTFPRGIGFTVNMPVHELPREFILFGEDASRVVVSCDPSQLPRIQQTALKYALSVDDIGQTGGEELQIQLDGQLVVSAPVSQLRDTYEGALENALGAEQTLRERD